LLTALTKKEIVMNSLAMLEWLVIAIIFAAGIYGCVISEVKKPRAATRGHAVSLNNRKEQ